MEKRDKDRIVKNIDNSIADLEKMIEEGQSAIQKLKNIRDTLTGQTKLKTK